MIVSIAQLQWNSGIRMKNLYHPRILNIVCYTSSQTQVGECVENQMVYDILDVFKKKSRRIDKIRNKELCMHQRLILWPIDHLKGENIFSTMQLSFFVIEFFEWRKDN